jgi:hypothetical protein
VVLRIEPQRLHPSRAEELGLTLLKAAEHSRRFQTTVLVTLEQPLDDEVACA